MTIHAAAAPMDSGGPFDLVGGLPVHPLVVHAVVVLVPLTALGLVVMAASPRFSKGYGWLVALSSVGAAAMSLVAKLAGEALAERVGEPGFDHEDLGQLMPIVAGVLMLVTLALWWVDRSAGPGDGRRGLRVVLAVVAVVVALGSAYWTYRVGDSGARSAWTGRVAGT